MMTTKSNWTYIFYYIWANLQVGFSPGRPDYRVLRLVKAVKNSTANVLKQTIIHFCLFPVFV